MQILKNLNAKQRLVVFILSILLSIFLLKLLGWVVAEKRYRDALEMTINQMRSGEFRSESGFRDLHWGAPSSELPGMELIDKRTSGKVTLAKYRRAGEELNFEGVPLRSVVYEFIVNNDVETFFSGTMFIDNSSGLYSTQIMEILDRRYGAETSDRDIHGGLAYTYEGQYTKAVYAPYGAAPYGDEAGGFITIIGWEMFILYGDITVEALKNKS